MSNQAWYDLNSKGYILKLHDHCHILKCKCQKQTTFTPRQFQMEGGSIKNKLKSIFRGLKAARNKFLKHAINVASPFIGMAVGAKTKSAQVAQATTNILKSISGGKNLSLTDMHGQGFKLKVM